jgi:hypothetical protein
MVHLVLLSLVLTSPPALLFYDFFLTLDWEVARYWGSSLTLPNVLFFLNRYGTLFGTIPVVFLFFWTAEPTPNKLLVSKSAVIRCVLTHVADVYPMPTLMNRQSDTVPYSCQHLHSYHQYFAIANQVLVGGAFALLRCRLKLTV